MIENQKLFGNYFDDIKITSTRLTNFGRETLNSLIKANSGGDYTGLINLLTDPLNNLKEELGNVDTSFTLQKGATLTNDQVLLNFKTTMNAEEPFIARAVGGRDSAIYVQFYPRGMSEYTTISKTSMPTLTSRVKVAASLHATILGPALTATLQAFETEWETSRDTQQQQRGAVVDNRTGRSDARNSLEFALIVAIGTIIAKFPGNVAQCSGFFDFNLLFPAKNNRNEVFTRPLAIEETITIVNRLFTDNTKITVRNPDDNASFVIWLASSEKEQSPVDAIEIKPGRTANIKPSDLGDLNNPFLLVKNLSNVNEGAYEVVMR